MTRAARPCIVIGSGPSGVAAAAALLERGQDVLLLDKGADLSSGARNRADAMAKKDPGAWTPQEMQWLAGGLAAGDAIPLKRLFGEDFMYAMEQPLPARFGQRPGQGAGGFSRVWGATIKRFGAAELSAWPIGETDLAPHYQAAENLIGPVGAPLSEQAAQLLARWQGEHEALKTAGASVLPSTLAVSPGCKRCAMCLYGCPYGYIYSSDMTVRHWHGRAGFRYRAGVAVTAIAENSDGVTVVLQNGGTQESVTGSRVFLAAGVLETARLMLVSFGAPGQTLHLQDGQYFLLPFLAMRAASQQQFHTLSQIFLTLQGEQPVHAQLYGQNDIYRAQIVARLGPLRPALASLADWAGRHFLLVQGYLPSSLSGSAQLSLQGSTLAVLPQHSAQTRPALRDVWKRLGRIGKLAGLHAVTPMAQEAEIGRGYHSGGTLPMANHPRGWQSDTLGRVNGLARVHVVDASTWPSIPSGPVTLSAMANAHRIAWQSMEQGS